MRRKRERKKWKKEDLIASSSEFRHSDGRSLSGSELKLATFQEVWIFPTLVNFYYRVRLCD